MDAPRVYTSAGAFRRALEDRLRQSASAENADLNRLRRQVSFDRLLARLFHDFAAPWVLKGGYALELRFKTARSTIDIDLVSATRAASSTQAMRDLLQEAASLDLADWFEFIIGAPTMDIDAAPYGGARYPIRARMDTRLFSRFNLDVALGETAMSPLETVQCRDWLQFAGVRPPRVQMIPREQHFAEKLHAYTLPRTSANSRVKDLVDLVLLIDSGSLEKPRVREALRVTFRQRDTHGLPEILEPPPADWRARFNEMATECEIAPEMDAAFERVRSFLAGLLGSAS